MAHSATPEPHSVDALLDPCWRGLSMENVYVVSFRPGPEVPEGMVDSLVLMQLS